MPMLAIVGMVLTGLLPQRPPNPTVEGRTDAADQTVRLADGAWQAWLELPGGDVPFTLELGTTERGRHAALVEHDQQRTTASRVQLEGTNLSIEWTDLACRLAFEVSDGGLALDGTWERQRTGKQRTRMTCRARFGKPTRASIPTAAFLPPTPGAAGLPPVATRGQVCAPRYRATLAGDRSDAVLVLQEGAVGDLTGTVLTVLGDYRQLSGRRVGNNVELWGFDGVHTILLRGHQSEDGTLQGDLWSADQHQVTWQATPDVTAALPDPYTQTKLRAAKLPPLTFEDLHGVPHTLDRTLLGDATLVLVFGSWCTNCHDATRLLGRLQQEHGVSGLRVVGLAFELSDDKAANRAALQAYAHRLGVSWPVLLAGTANQEHVAKALPFLDKLVAYPTVLFVDKAGTIRATYTGFTSAAAVEEHALLVEDWQSRITELLR